MLRDSLFYLMSFAFVLIIFTYDQLVTWWDATSMVALYLTFVTILLATRDVKGNKAPISDPNHTSPFSTTSTIISSPSPTSNDNNKDTNDIDDSSNDIDDVDGEARPLLGDAFGGAVVVSPTGSAAPSPFPSRDLEANIMAPSSLPATITEVPPSVSDATNGTASTTTATTVPPSTSTMASSPSRPLSQLVIELSSLPFDMLFRYTIPDSSNGGRWPFTFAMTLIYSFGVAYTLVNFAFYLICKLGIELVTPLRRPSGSISNQ
jgi:hypothetical protein